MSGNVPCHVDKECWDRCTYCIRSGQMRRQARNMVPMRLGSYHRPHSTSANLLARYYHLRLVLSSSSTPVTVQPKESTMSYNTEKERKIDGECESDVSQTSN
jgi:hypothetical protein